MSPHTPLTIAGQTVQPGEARSLQIQFSESYIGTAVTIPIQVIRGPEAGPRLFLTGVIHGDELSGAGIIREIAFGESLRLARGTLICVPVVNTFGLEHHTRYLPDRRDLNRCFPGSPTGSLTSRLAHLLFSEVIRQCDYGIDFHSAAVRKTNYPNIRGDSRNPGVKALARAFGSEIIISSTGIQGSLRKTAADAGIPTIIFEGGEVWKIEPGIVAIGVRGTLNVLKHLGMIEGEPEKPLFQTIVHKTHWVRAQRGGFLAYHSKTGDLVEEGQPLATNYNIFGRERSQLVSPVRGILLGMSTMPAVKPGDPVYHVASLPAKTFEGIRRKLESSPREHLFGQVQNDLATNVTLRRRQ